MESLLQRNNPYRIQQNLHLLRIILIVVIDSWLNRRILGFHRPIDHATRDVRPQNAFAMDIRSGVQYSSPGRAIRPLPAPTPIRSQLPVTAFAGMRLIPTLARRVACVPSTSRRGARNLGFEGIKSHAPSQLRAADRAAQQRATNPLPERVGQRIESNAMTAHHVLYTSQSDWTHE
jgi:hypothetical protein